MRPPPTRPPPSRRPPSRRLPRRPSVAWAPNELSSGPLPSDPARQRSRVGPRTRPSHDTRTRRTTDRGTFHWSRTSSPLARDLRADRRCAVRARLLYRGQVPDAEARHRPAGRHPCHADRAHPGRQPAQSGHPEAAQEIIETRVNGLGVSGSEVVIDGDNLVITVPGDDSSQARSLGQTARLYIRPVQTRRIPRQAPAQAPRGRDTGTRHEPAPRRTGPFPAQGRAPRLRPSGDPPAGTAPRIRAPVSAGRRQAAAEIAEAEGARQSTDPAVQRAGDGRAATHRKPDPLQGNDDPALPLVACSTDGTTVYLLGPSIIDGQEIADATSGFNSQQSRNEVSLTFKSSGSNTWAKFTAANIGKQAAFMLDSKVVSAPVRSRARHPRAAPPRSPVVHRGERQGAGEHPEVRFAAAVLLRLRGRDRVRDPGARVAEGGPDRRRHRPRRWCCSTASSTTGCLAC